MQTPILLLVFNRPDVTLQVFEAIRKAKPPKLYIAADGARDSKAGEKELCDETRKIAELVDWDCEVHKLFREKNLGCRLAVSSGIDWFFANEEEGIILEDDCLPDPSFFPFCEQLLEYYRHDTRIGHISGDNFQEGIKRGNGSYYFSRYPHIWGWASWRRAWNKYQLEMPDYPTFSSSQQLRNVFNTRSQRVMWQKIFDNTYYNNPSTWDYQWMYAVTKENMLSILPQANLIKNIGFGVQATHTSSSNRKIEKMPLQSISEKLIHPTIILPDTEADYYSHKKFFTSEIIFKRIPKKIFYKIRKLLS